MFRICCLAFCLMSTALGGSPKLRFFNLDLHVSVIADVRYIFEILGHDVENWSLSGHTWVFGKEANHVDIVNENTWYYLDQSMCDRFYERYKDYLNQFDGFIVTHTPCFALLYEKFDKPIIIINSTRYESPFTLHSEKWKWLNEYLKKGVEKGKIFIISNNKADQHYLEFYTGIHSRHIPSLCLYTGAHYTGKRPGFIFKGNIPQLSLKDPSLVQNNQLRRRYDWQELYDFQGIVHMPYQISTMSLFEEYSAGVPLFFPSPAFLTYLQIYTQALHQLSYVPPDADYPYVPGDLNNIYDPEVVNQWIERADFYDQENMPYIQYFDSYEHLETLLQTADLSRISQNMREHQKKREARVIEAWQEVLNDLPRRNPSLYN